MYHTVFAPALYYICTSDPHPANLLVRNRGDGHPQLVLLDHGLYIDLAEKFRKDYCRLWHSIVTSDSENIKKYCKEMNAEETYTLLTAMLTLRPWHDVIHKDFSKCVCYLYYVALPACVASVTQIIGLFLSLFVNFSIDVM